MSYGPYACPECQGYGEVTCHCCDSETTCEHCRGRHYDPNKIDLDAYEAACKQLKGSPTSGGTYAAMNGRRQYVGRTNGIETVLVNDFRRKDASA
jgi:hypothetical protein